MADLDEAGRVAAAFGFAGELVPGIRWAGSDCTAVVRLDHAEIARREAAGLGVLEHARHYQLVEVLFELPLGIPVPWADLDPVRAAELDGAPAGVVCRTAEAVERLWRPALTITGLLTIADNTRQGLRRVGILAPDAPRAVATRRRPRRATRARAEQLGIGVAVTDNEGRWQVLVAPHRHLVSPGPRHWRLLELVYDLWRHRPSHQQPLFPTR